jgi:hypothetical protein
MSASDLLEVAPLISSDQDGAARHIADSVCSGDLESARFWALEYAIHRDNDKTYAERDVWLAASKERHPLRVRVGVDS